MGSGKTSLLPAGYLTRSPQTGPEVGAASGVVGASEVVGVAAGGPGGVGR